MCVCVCLSKGKDETKEKIRELYHGLNEMIPNIEDLLVRPDNSP